MPFADYFDQRSGRFASFYRSRPIARVLGRGALFDRLDFAVERTAALGAAPRRRHRLRQRPALPTAGRPRRARFGDRTGGANGRAGRAARGRLRRPRRRHEDRLGGARGVAHGRAVRRRDRPRRVRLRAERRRPARDNGRHRTALDRVLPAPGSAHESAQASLRRARRLGTRLLAGAHPLARERERNGDRRARALGSSRVHLLRAQRADRSQHATAAPDGARP